MRKKLGYLSDYVTSQYPIEKLKKLISISIDIVQTFLISLEEEFDYSPSSIALFEEKYGSSVRNNKSKVESIFIKKMKTEEQMRDFLTSYYRAYMFLSNEEKQIFNATFIDNLTDIEIIIKYDTYTNRIQAVRRSAIVKFCVRSGLDKFVDII